MGKKKGDKKKQEEKNVEDSASPKPTTSTTAEPKPEEMAEEDEGGLGLGGSRKKRNKPRKGKDQQAASATSTPIVEQESPAPVVSPVSTETVQQEPSEKKGDKRKQEDKNIEVIQALNLDDQPSTSQTSSNVEELEGLTGSMRKKKPTEVIPTMSPPSETPKAPEPKTSENIDDDEGGLGLGSSKKKRNRPRKPKKDQQPSSSAAVAVEPGTLSPPAAVLPEVVQQPQVASSWKAAGVSNYPGQQTAAHPSTPPYPVQQQPGPSTSSPSYPAMPPGFGQPHWGSQSPRPVMSPGASLSPSASLSPGASQSPRPIMSPGVSLSPRPIMSPRASASLSTRPMMSPGASLSPGASQSPRASVPPRASLPPGASQSSRPSRPQGDTAECEFLIPTKIIGNTVPHDKIVVMTNYLPMTIKPIKIYRYDITIIPDKPKKMLGKAFSEVKRLHFENHLTAFDQMKNCYTLRPLPKVPQFDRFNANVEIQDHNHKIMKFEVSIKHTGVVDLNTILEYMKNGTSLNPPSEAIQCIDVILRQGALESYVKAGRQFFKRPSKPLSLGDGLEIWTGLFQSAIFGSRPFVNIDVAHKGFPKPEDLIMVMKDFDLEPTSRLEDQRQKRFKLEKFKIFIKGLKVVAAIGGNTSATGLTREFICNDITQPANVLKFEMKDSNTNKTEVITVEKYFQRMHNYRIQYPYLNCMWVGPKDKNIYYPIELLKIAHGQIRNKQLNETQLPIMVNMAATKPDIRLKKIYEVMADMSYSNNSDFKDFGLEIGNKFVNVNAKIIRPPKLNIGGKWPIEPRKGRWTVNGLKTPTTIPAWGYIGLEIRCSLEQTIKALKDAATLAGIVMGDPLLSYNHANEGQLESIFKTAREKSIKLLFVIISGAPQKQDLYQKVKKLAERNVGILTQCIKERNASRADQQTFNNIMLKVNSKLMGINQTLDASSVPKCLKEGGVMIVGADVTHPSPDQKTIPSLAAVTASLDAECYQYNITLSVQTPKKEMIVQFADMMIEHLKKYYALRRQLPRKVFVFRDGVSEGQFKEVMQCELRAIYEAYYRLTGDANKRPKILFVLVQKRHHTRFFTTDSSPINVSPGTCVDTDIVHAREMDFYLVSHDAIKGTARPTRYHTVWNEGAIPQDEVEQLTYYLCHMYARCKRSVSYPAPTYYAHLACLRAKALTYGETFNFDTLITDPQRIHIHQALQSNPMFFV